MPPKRAPVVDDDEQLKRVMMRIPGSLHHRLRVRAAEQRTTMEEIARQSLERELSLPVREPETRKRRTA
jgi:plasmid stability protein